MTAVTVKNAEIVNAGENMHTLLRRYIAYIDAKPKTIETYKRALRQFARFLADQNIQNPTRESVILYRDYLLQEHKASTVQNYIVAVRLFFQWTETEGIYPNIASRVKGTSVSKEHKKDYLTGTQVREVLASIDKESKQGKRDFAILSLMVTGGLRTIEVVRANVEDLRTVGNDPVLYVQGKGKDDKAEYIRIPEEVETAIRDYLRTRKASGSEPLFVSTSHNSAGQRLTTRSISGIVKSRLVSAGYNSETLTAHSLRHTAVTLSLIGGEDLQTVKQFARHSNIETTLIYAHNIEKSANTCSRTVAASIFPGINGTQ